MKLRICNHVSVQPSTSTTLLRLMFYKLLAITVHAIILATSLTVTHANDSGDALSLTELPIGQSREAVLPAAETRWASVVHCTTKKTGVGLTKRAYFLETCVFENNRLNTLFDETPTSAHYIFLEDRLVQIGYQFSQVDNLKKLRRCAESDVQKYNAGQTSRQTPRQGVSVADDGHTLVFDIELVSQIHALNSAQ